MVDPEDVSGRRRTASTAALDRYDLAGIESGAVQETIDAALELTALVYQLLGWYDEARASERGPRGIGDRRRLADAAARVTDAHLELKESVVEQEKRLTERRWRVSKELAAAAKLAERSNSRWYSPSALRRASKRD